VISISKEAIVSYLQRPAKNNPTLQDHILAQQSRLLTEKYYGNKVFLRGMVEFSNFCSQSCHYCGLRAQNSSILRYRLSVEEILETVKQIYHDGIRSVVLQSGEDIFYTNSVIAHLCYEIRSLFPDIAITLSIGERSLPAYRKFRASGATRFLMKHETCNPSIYRQVHPSQELSSRLHAQQLLKKAGFIVGSGFLLGLPGQTLEDIYQELLFLQQNQFDMWGIGLFLPANGTPLEKQPSGDPNLVHRSMICSRIFDPPTMIPITTAYHSTVGNQETIQSIHDVANVFMVNYTPDKVKKLYSIYDHKQSLTLDKTCLFIEKAGKKPSFEKGEPIRVHH
jgi:biotin synthase